MARKALIAANWKMYKTPAEAKAFVDAFLPLVAGHTRDEIALFPSPVLLPTVIPACKGSNVAVGARKFTLPRKARTRAKLRCCRSWRWAARIRSLATPSGGNTLPRPTRS